VEGCSACNETLSRSVGNDTMKGGAGTDILLSLPPVWGLAVR
jgi:hypothetical protein